MRTFVGHRSGAESQRKRPRCTSSRAAFSSRIRSSTRLNRSSTRGRGASPGSGEQWRAELHPTKRSVLSKMMGSRFCRIYEVRSPFACGSRRRRHFLFLLLPLPVTGQALGHATCTLQSSSGIRDKKRRWRWSSSRSAAEFGAASNFMSARLTAWHRLSTFVVHKRSGLSRHRGGVGKGRSSSQLLTDWKMLTAVHARSVGLLDPVHPSLHGFALPAAAQQRLM